MALNLDYEFLFVGRDENSFLENYTCDFKQEYGDKSGQIFANIEIKNNAAEAESIGIMVFDAMQKVFFENVEADPYERFEETLKAINGVLANMRSQKESGFIGDFNMIIVATIGNVVYLSQTGEAEAYLIRKRYVSIISEGLDDDGSDDVFSNIASGTVETGDFVLLSNTRLLRYISKTDLAASMRRGKVSDSLMEIRDVVSTEMLGRLGLTGIHFMEEVVLEEESVLEDALEEALEESVLVEKVEASTEVLPEGGEVHTVSHEKTQRRFKNTGSKKAKAVKEGANNMWKRVSGMVLGGSGGVGNSRNKILIALIGVIAILLISIVVANGLGTQKAELERLDKILESVESKITEAETKGNYSKEEAIVILDKAYADAVEVSNSGLYRDKANIYMIQIEEARDRLDDVTRIDDPIVYVDIAELVSDADALGFVAVDKRLFVFETNRMYEIVLDQVQAAIDIDSEETIIAATGFDDRSSVVFLTKSGKLIEYNEGTISYMDTEDESFRKAVAIDDWSSRIYLLDDVEGQIWKYGYKNSREQFGAGEAYLAEVSEDVKGARDFAIDSNIYVLGSDSKLMKYYGGEDQNLVVAEQAFNSFDSAEKIFTSENVDHVLVLDDEQNRIFVFEKDFSTGRLVYKLQFLFDGVGEIRDVFISESDPAKILVLGSDKIYQLSI